MNTPQLITPTEAVKLGSDTLFLDVRTPAEFQEVHIGGAILHPLSDLDPTKVQALLEGKTGGVIVCRSGGRARQACEKLLATGVSNIRVLEGGVSAWSSSGFPVVRGKKTISLERQVRIAAGSLVVLGSLLGYLVSPVFIALSAFVGAGLVFAGITDTCGMGMLLAKMPWNTRSSAGPSCCVVGPK
jgi:rhodanese-related sulfurtransferase